MLSDTGVSTMQAYCNEDEECVLISATTKTMLPVTHNSSQDYSLGSCDVPDINIIHDCEVRKLPLEAKLIDVYGRYYLYVSLTIYHIHSDF